MRLSCRTDRRSVALNTPAVSDAALLELARQAAGKAYCPYSHFPVGAVVVTDAGTFTGCNIENASYGLSLCAERVALFSAIANGAKRIDRLAVACIAATSSDSLGSRMPCGACRQVIAEFMAAEAEVLVDGAGVWRVSELLPTAFQLQTMPFLMAGESLSTSANSSHERDELS